MSMLLAYANVGRSFGEYDTVFGGGGGAEFPQEMSRLNTL